MATAYIAAPRLMRRSLQQPEKKLNLEGRIIRRTRVGLFPSDICINRSIIGGLGMAMKLLPAWDYIHVFEQTRS